MLPNNTEARRMEVPNEFLKVVSGRIPVNLSPAAGFPPALSEIFSVKFRSRRPQWLPHPTNEGNSRYRFQFALILFFVFPPVIFMACGSTPMLSSDEIAKVAPPLRPLLEGNPPAPGGCMPVQRPDGTLAYLVIIHGSAQELRDAGIAVQSAVDDIITAAVTGSELQRLVRLPTVRSVGCGSTAKPD
jgi:hypothetical protein